MSGAAVEIVASHCRSVKWRCPRAPSAAQPDSRGTRSVPQARRTVPRARARSQRRRPAIEALASWRYSPRARTIGRPWCRARRGGVRLAGPWVLAEFVKGLNRLVARYVPGSAVGRDVSARSRVWSAGRLTTSALVSTAAARRRPGTWEAAAGSRRGAATPRSRAGRRTQQGRRRRGTRARRCSDRSPRALTLACAVGRRLLPLDLRPRSRPATPGTPSRGWNDGYCPTKMPSHASPRPSGSIGTRGTPRSRGLPPREARRGPRSIPSVLSSTRGPASSGSTWSPAVNVRASSAAMRSQPPSSAALGETRNVTSCTRPSSVSVVRGRNLDRIAGEIELDRDGECGAERSSTSRAEPGAVAASAVAAATRSSVAERMASLASTPNRAPWCSR